MTAASPSDRGFVMAEALSPLLQARPRRQIPNRRVQRLSDELGFAFSRLERNTLKAWGIRSSTRLLMLAGQRVGGLARLATLLARYGSGELSGLFSAVAQRRLMTHLGDRSAAAIDGTLAIGRDGGHLLAGIAKGLLNDPKKNAPAVLGAVLGFSAGSGGLDANGGIPDLDLLAGIGAHRSPITHTIIAGIVVEGLILATADLAAEIHERLPVDHDPLWDSLATIGRPLSENLAIGTSAGLAWHLLADAFVQPGTYHDLPIDMPMEAHQAMFAANGAAEGMHAARQTEKHLPLTVEHDGLRAKSPGRKVVDAVGNAASSTFSAASEQITAFGRKLWK